MNKIEIGIGDSILSIEKGNVARQADGSVWVRCGETIVLVTAVAAKEEREDAAFFPLTCDYREEFSAAGKIPGGFFKREGRPSERETLICRLIDRSIRPLFPENYFKEVQIISLVLSLDPENDPDLLSIIGASAALTSSKIPFSGPIGAVKVGLVEDTFVINPTISQLENSQLSLLLSGTENSIIMMEGWAKEISEEKFLEAVSLGFEKIKEVIAAQKPWIAQKEESVSANPDEQIKEKAENLLQEKLKQLYDYSEKKDRNQFYQTLKEEFLAGLEDEEKKKEGEKVFEKVLKDKIRKLILTEGKRLDGRESEDIRSIDCKINLLPRTHGSSMFTRGQTQCLASVTLGTSSDEQTIDGLYEKTSKRFMLHYNFPPFSVGEASFLKGPSRRDIGHGALAEKSLSFGMPDEEKFPYTVRIVADILESNGSSSMATVCAGSLALMDAGIPVQKHVAGIALGMIAEENKHIILTDIAGEEDHYGDMDLKIAGTIDGITGFQMDVKSCCLTYEILKKAVEQSKKARVKILENMHQTISSPKPSISAYAPQMIRFLINPDKIGLVIGPGGKTIKRIIEETKVKIDVDDTGEVKISSPDKESCQKAEKEIKSLIEEPEIGKIYEGTVTKILAFGAFVKILPSQEGMIHISELAPQRVNKVEDILKVGDTVKAKVLKIDGGKISLSRKQALSS